MPHGLVISDGNLIAKWAFDHFRLFPTQINMALGIVDKNKNMVGAVLLQNYNGVNVELSYYGPHTLSVGIVRAIARVAIGQFNAVRVTVVTSKRNRRLMNSLLRFGFRLEGVQRCYYGREDTKKNTGVRFVMFRETVDRIASGRSAVPNLIKQG